MSGCSLNYRLQQSLRVISSQAACLVHAGCKEMAGKAGIVEVSASLNSHVVVSQLNLKL